MIGAGSLFGGLPETPPIPNNNVSPIAPKWKSEEIRNPKIFGAGFDAGSIRRAVPLRFRANGGNAVGHGIEVRRAILRVSDFGRLSAFGFRVLAFPIHLNSSPRRCGWRPVWYPAYKTGFHPDSPRP